MTKAFIKKILRETIVETRKYRYEWSKVSSPLDGQVYDRILQYSRKDFDAPVIEVYRAPEMMEDN